MSSEAAQVERVAHKQPESPPRKALVELATEVRRTFGFEADLDLCEDRPILSVYDAESQRSAEVSCDLVPPGWWFTWATGDEYEGRTICPADGVGEMACYLARFLRPAPEDLA